MTILSPEQRDLVRQSSGEAVRLVDPDTRQEYVLMRAEIYDQLQSFMPDLEPRDLYPALARALKDEGWDDPQVVEYNRYG
jgi:hypothetical protein